MYLFVYVSKVYLIVLLFTMCVVKYTLRNIIVDIMLPLVTQWFNNCFNYELYILQGIQIEKNIKHPLALVDFQLSF